jgi:hypothetical protein
LLCCACCVAGGISALRFGRDDRLAEVKNLLGTNMPVVLTVSICNQQQQQQRRIVMRLTEFLRERDMGFPAAQRLHIRLRTRCT